jgi:heptaprenylglyceryl phosphate synthase
MYTNIDTAFVKSQGDPVADPSNISLVRTPKTCQAAVDAYNQSHALTGAPHIASAYVIALGGSGYIVVNPDETVGEFTSMFLYDRNWVLKRELAG